MGSYADAVLVREIKKDECSLLLDMMLELADHLNERDLVINTVEGLRQDLFGEPKRCSCLVAERVVHGENTNYLVGYSMYFPAYCSFTRTYIYMEDLYVRKDYRRAGIGKRLFQGVAQKGLDLGCQKVEFNVKLSNEKAKAFYESLDAIDQTEADGRHRMRVTRKQMEHFVMP